MDEELGCDSLGEMIRQGGTGSLGVRAR
jgi:hypothetical protein